MTTTNNIEPIDITIGNNGIDPKEFVNNILNSVLNDPNATIITSSNTTTNVTTNIGSNQKNADVFKDFNKIFEQNANKQPQMKQNDNNEIIDPQNEGQPPPPYSDVAAQEKEDKEKKVEALLERVKELEQKLNEKESASTKGCVCILL